MPRQLSFTVCPWPDYRDGQSYRSRVVRVAKSTKPSGLAVQLEHLDSEQEGRGLQVVLPLPPRPEGLTASFFRACGMEIAIGARIVPKDAVGAIVAALVSCQPGGQASVAAFEPIKEKHE